MKRAGNPKKGFSFLKFLLALVLGAGAFFAGMWYLPSARSTKYFVTLKEIRGDEATLFRPPSGIFDPYLKDMEDSPTVNIPLGERCTLLDKDNKKTTPEYYGDGYLRRCRISIGPDNTLWSVKEIGIMEEDEGEILLVEGSDIHIGDFAYYSRDAVFLLKEKAFFPKAGEEKPGVLPADPVLPVEKGDLVKVQSYGGEAAVVELLENHGFLRVEAPQGATVYIDGVIRGTAPGEFQAAPGLKEVKVKKTGFSQGQEEVLIRSGEMSVLEIPLTRSTSMLSVDSTPMGATVLVDEKDWGLTPKDLELAVGNHVIKIVLDGYEPEERTVILKANKEQTLLVELNKRKGSVGENRFSIIDVNAQSRTINVYGQNGRSQTIRLSQNAKLDGWDVTDFSLQRLMPGEEIKVGLNSEGLADKITTVSTHSFVREGVLMHVEGDEIFLGSAWQRLRLNGARIVDEGGTVLTEGLAAGDVVTVYGSNDSDIKYVCRKSTLGTSRSFEAFLSEGKALFDDLGKTTYSLPETLTVADFSNKATLNIQDVPIGARLKFSVDEEGKIIRAQIISKPQSVAIGRINDIAGSSLYIGPSWEKGDLLQDTAVFLKDKRTQFYDIKLGDKVTAAIGADGTLQFLRIEERLDSKKEVPAILVTSGLSGIKGKSAYIMDSAMKDIGTPVQLDEQGIFSCPEKIKEIFVKDLLPGDRMSLFLGNQGKILWGRVLSRQDEFQEGRYLGEYRKEMYLTGFQEYRKADDFICVGLPKGQGLYPGAKVAASLKDGLITYLEVKESIPTLRPRDAVVVSLDKDSILLKTGRLISTYELDKDAYFVDWNTEEDGPMSDLCAGDEISYGTVQGKVYMAERVYSHPFKIEGTIERIQDRQGTIVLGTEDATRTLVVGKNALICKDGSSVSFSSLKAGDKINAAGSSYDSLQVVVVKNGAN